MLYPGPWRSSHCPAGPKRSDIHSLRRSLETLHEEAEQILEYQRHSAAGAKGSPSSIGVSKNEARVGGSPGQAQM